MQNARTITMMSGKRLPYDAEVEYLESTRTQWIDTGVAGQSGIDMDFGFSLTSIGSPQAIGGCFTNLQSLYVGIVRANGYFAYHYGNTNKVIVQIQQVAANTYYHVQAHLYNGEQYYILNGNKSAVGEIAGNFVSPLNIHLFRINSSTPTYSSGVRIYALKIYVNGVLVRDFIPVRRGTVGYLYDRVSGKLFGNDGTGDFVLGQDVVPVEWLGCDGSQYIDTKVVATNSHGFRVDIEAAKKAVDVNTRIFGAHEGNVRCGFALYGEPPSDDYFWGWNEATGFRATIPQRFVVSLNYKNDRAAIFNGTTNLSQLGTLGGMTQSVYLLNANYGNAPFANQFVVGKFYGAEITVGSDVANHYIPVRVGMEGAMMDVLTRRIYRNAGTGAFTYGNDLKYPIPSE